MLLLLRARAPRFLGFELFETSWDEGNRGKETWKSK